MKIKNVKFIGEQEVFDLSVSNLTYMTKSLLHHNCKHCWSLWTMPDKKTPKAYKLSELSAGPGNWKNPDASISPTHPNCFTEGQVPVLTDSGWKALEKIKMGDKVLTHTGRFKTVVGIINEPYPNKENIIIQYRYNGIIYKHHVTPDHKFLTNRGWVEAADLTTSDKFVSLKYTDLVSQKQTKLKDELEFGAAKTYRHPIRFKNLFFFTFLEAIRRIIPARNTKKQCHVYTWVQSYNSYEEVTAGRQVGRGSVGTGLSSHKILISVDNECYFGGQFPQEPTKKEKLLSQGWAGLYLIHKREIDTKRYQVIDGTQNSPDIPHEKWAFDEAQILDIKKSKTNDNGRVYCLTVEEDHSFIARGVVSSNCRDVLVTIMPGFGFDENGKIVYKGIDPETGQPWDEYLRQRK